jgi:hypothetical protein
MCTIFGSRLLSKFSKNVRNTPLCPSFFLEEIPSLIQWLPDKSSTKGPNSYRGFTVDITLCNSKNQEILTDNMDIAKLRLSSDSVNLAHVSALVLLLNIRDVEEPRFVFVMLVVCH